MGGSLCRAMPAFGVVPPALDPIAWPTAFAAAAAALRLPRAAALAAWLWSWAESQVLVAVKCVPLGQQAGQRLLFGLHGDVARAVDDALARPDEAIGTAAIGLALVSALHETQYSRLYRS
jgi:urease accessory protein